MNIFGLIGIFLMIFGIILLCLRYYTIKMIVTSDKAYHERIEHYANMLNVTKEEMIPSQKELLYIFNIGMTFLVAGGCIIYLEFFCN